MLDLRSNSHNSNASTGSKPLRSPRMHIAGEAPPEFSPLDAFAMQSRLLARQLQESTKEGNRVSRLPPLTTESPLVMQGRSDYFRSLSHDSESDMAESPEPDSAGLGLRTEYEDAFTPEDRPKSMHPRMSRIPPTPEDSLPSLPKGFRDESRGRQLNRVEEDDDFFGARREHSPSSMHSDLQHQFDKPVERSPFRNDSSRTIPSPALNALHSGSPEKSRLSHFEETGLVPPRAIFPKRSSSIMSSPLAGADDESSSNLGGSFHSLPPRKLSSGSAAFSNPMASPALGSFHQRSPSVGSDSSALPRPSFNFSRPLSRAGTPSFDAPSRQASSDSQPSFILADESAHTPISMHSEAFMEQQLDDGKAAASSYIYSKFSLPRGKTIQRSEEPADKQAHASFQWEQPIIPPSNVHRYPLGAPPSPPSRPSSSSARIIPDDAMSMMSSATRPSMDTSKVSMESSRLGMMGNPSPNPSRPSNDGFRKSEDVPRGRPRTSPHDAPRGRTAASTSTTDTASTIRPPPTARSVAPSASEISAEEHLAKGIALHESGSLNESTYHLRYAARQNNPTAMLLYALACRHGWGMRANQREGVQWLRKAAEFAGVEIADDEDQAKEGKHVDIVESRTRKAQFALSIYELGVSHMNGWGIEQDKSLALRCFEIAGSELHTPQRR